MRRYVITWRHVLLDTWHGVWGWGFIFLLREMSACYREALITQLEAISVDADRRARSASRVANFIIASVFLLIVAVSAFPIVPIAAALATIVVFTVLVKDVIVTAADGSRTAARLLCLYRYDSAVGVPDLTHENAHRRLVEILDLIYPSMC